MLRNYLVFAIQRVAEGRGNRCRFMPAPTRLSAGERHGLNRVGEGADPIDQPSDLRRPDQRANRPGKLSRLMRALNRILVSRMT